MISGIDIRLSYIENMDVGMDILAGRPYEARQISFGKLSPPDMSGKQYKCNITCSLADAGPGAASSIFSALGIDYADAFYSCCSKIVEAQEQLLAEQEKIIASEQEMRNHE